MSLLAWPLVWTYWPLSHVVHEWQKHQWRIFLYLMGKILLITNCKFTFQFLHVTMSFIKETDPSGVRFFDPKLQFVSFSVLLLYKYLHGLWTQSKHLLPGKISKGIFIPFVVWDLLETCVIKATSNMSSLDLSSFGLIKSTCWIN